LIEKVKGFWRGVQIWIKMVKMQLPPLLLGLLIVIGLAGAAGLVFLAWRIVQLRADLRRSRGEAAEALAQLDLSRRELESVLKINREMIQAQDEQGLVRAALAAVNGLAGGLGCSYVPFDAWGEPLQAHTFGDLPEPVLKGWAEHLVSEHVRSRCLACQKLHAAPGQECPLHVGPLGAAMAIYCLPLTLGQRRLGMVNLYLRSGQTLDPALNRFLGRLMDQMALAVEAQRLLDQENSLLRHLQHLRSPRSELSAGLSDLLENARRALGADGLALQVRPMADERLSNLRVQTGALPLELPGELLDALRLGLEHPLARQAAGGELDWAVEPVVLPHGQLLGLVYAARRGVAQPVPDRWNGIQTAAAQAALMIENERQMLSLEYSLVMQERARLAREIHDGLAQTLAFLKMQAAQMQSALAQGDQTRLARLLQENRAALADAYKETRQAIDNLRLSPDDGLISWIGHAAREFEKLSGIKAETVVAEPVFELLPETQAHLVRILQEALNNVRKHAQASQVRISLRPWERDLILEVVDDGRGFDPEDVPVAAQYGLRGMRERAELIGAEFQIASQPSRGTTVRVCVPFQVEEMHK